MEEFVRRVMSGLLLLAGALVLWYVGDFLFFSTRMISRRFGPPWALAFIGLGTILLGTIWFRYGGTRALRRWGVTIKPTSPPDPLVTAMRDNEDVDAGSDLGAAGRRRHGSGD